MSDADDWTAWQAISDWAREWGVPDHVVSSVLYDSPGKVQNRYHKHQVGLRVWRLRASKAADLQARARRDAALVALGNAAARQS